MTLAVTRPGSDECISLSVLLNTGIARSPRPARMTAMARPQCVRNGTGGSHEGVGCSFHGRRAVYVSDLALFLGCHVAADTIRPLPDL